MAEKMMKLTSKEKIYYFPKSEYENFQKITKKNDTPLSTIVEKWINENQDKGRIEKKAAATEKKPSEEKKKNKPRTVVYSDEELKIVEIIATALKNAEVGDVTKPKPKTINVKWKDVEYSINVVKHRPPKE